MTRESATADPRRAVAPERRCLAPAEAAQLDVVVVGYGPVGATAANLLGQAGFRTAVFEPATCVYHLPRAAHFDGEVMRVFQSLGLVDALAPAVTPVRGMHFVTGAGEKLFGVEARDLPTDHGWGAGYMFYQPDLERALRAGVARWPEVTVDLGHEVVDLVQDADRVEVTVRDLARGATRTVAARWVFGCDGARSLTRRLAGIALEDLEFDQPWLVIDTRLRRPVALPELVQQVCDPARPATFVPSAGDHRRWEFMLLPGEDPEAMQRPERIAELLAPWVGPADVEVTRAAVYSFHALLARRWRAGRTFLVGDAAHQMPPFLGQGMCAGIRDAVNLVWKLRLLRAGHAGEDLLDSYQQERAPHVRTVIELAVGLGRILQTTDTAVAAARDAQFRETRASGGSDPLATARIPGLRDGLLHRSRGSEDPAGQVFPQVRVRTAGGDETLLDDLLGPGFALVARGDPTAGLTAAARGLLERLGVRRVSVAAGVGGVEGARPPAGNAESVRPSASDVGGGSAMDDAIRVQDLDGRLDAWLARHGTALVRPDRYVFGVAAAAEEREALVTALARGLGTGDRRQRISAQRARGSGRNPCRA